MTGQEARSAAQDHAEAIRAGILAGDDMPDGSIVTDALDSLAVLVLRLEDAVARELAARPKTNASDGCRTCHRPWTECEC